MIVFARCIVLLPLGLIVLVFVPLELHVLDLAVFLVAQILRIRS